MKFIVSSSTLLKNIQLISGVINNNNTLPILDDFLFDLNLNKLTITASDLETTISTQLEVDSEDIKKIAIPSRILLDTLKTFPNQPLTFIEKEESHQLEIVSEQGNYELAYEDAEEFPATPELEESTKINISSGILSEAIAKTIFATGDDELRPVMTGVFFQLGTDICRFVATDAHRLVKYSRKDIQAEEVIEFIMPKKPLNLLRNTLANFDKEVSIEYNAINTRFRYDNIELTCRLIDGKYPNYNAVIPKENPNVLTINRSLFLSSLKRVAIFSNKTTHQIRLKLSGSLLILSAENVDFSNKAEERIPCDYQGVDLQIGFNAKFLTEMINNLQADDITIEMSEPGRAGIIKPLDGLDEGEEVLMLVMPVMLNT